MSLSRHPSLMSIASETRSSLPPRARRARAPSPAPAAVKRKARDEEDYGPPIAVKRENKYEDFGPPAGLGSEEEIFPPRLPSPVTPSFSSPPPRPSPSHSPPPSPPPHSSPPPTIAAPTDSFTAFQQAQLADQPRLPWVWATHGKAAQLYVSVVEGKWWSGLGSGIAGSKARDIGHVGRIMETELGEKLEGELACSSCRDLGQECWVYSQEGARQVKYAGSTCARCRVAARSGGCSKSTRVRRPRSSPPPPTPSHISPRGPGGPPRRSGGSSLAIERV